MSKKKNVYGSEFSTVLCRLSYNWLHEVDPHEKYGGKYTVDLLIPKKSVGNEEYLGIQSIIDEIAEKCGSDATIEAITKACKHNPFADGNKNIQDGDAGKLKDTEGYAGNYVMSAKNSPEFSDLTLFERIAGETHQVDRSDKVHVKKTFYPGCYVTARMKVGYFPDDNTVSLFFLSLVKVKEGERLGSPQEDQNAVVAGMDFSSIPGLEDVKDVEAPEEVEEVEAPKEEKAVKKSLMDRAAK